MVDAVRSPGLSRRIVLAASGWTLAAWPVLANSGAVPRFAVALGGREELRAWGDAAAGASAAWWPRIVAALPDPTFAPPAVVTLAVARIGVSGAVAVTQGDTVTVDADFLAAHPGDPNDVQLLAHELVHVVQKYPEGHSVWLSEGIADWIRYYVILPDDPRRAFRPGAGETYRRGYQPAAALLDWCERQTPGVVAEVHRAMRRGQDGPATLGRLSGASLDALWRACPASRLGVGAP